MKILTTFPGRAGDLLWALPTIRAISEAVGQPVDLQIAGEFAGMVDLLVLQPYLGAVWADPRWGLSDQDSWKAPLWLADHDHVIHLGYRRWPEKPLPLETADSGLIEAALCGITLGEVDLVRPWITLPNRLAFSLAAGWTDCHFELKAGLMHLLTETRGRAGYEMELLVPPGSRWVTEYTDPWGDAPDPTSWLEAAAAINQAQIFFGDCSALHVLACALGKPCVLVEPMEARWNPIFYPYGMDGPQVRVVKGNDGEPTFDARHTADVLKEVLGVR